MKKAAQAAAGLPQHGGPIIDSVDGYDVIDCQVCGFRHIDPLFTDDDLRSFYNGEFYEKERADYFSRAEEDKEWWTLRYHHYFETLEEHAPGRRVYWILGPALPVSWKRAATAAGRYWASNRHASRRTIPARGVFP